MQMLVWLFFTPYEGCSCSMMLTACTKLIWSWFLCITVCQTPSATVEFLHPSSSQQRQALYATGRGRAGGLCYLWAVLPTRAGTVQQERQGEKCKGLIVGTVPLIFRLQGKRDSVCVMFVCASVYFCIMILDSIAEIDSCDASHNQHLVGIQR